MHRLEPGGLVTPTNVLSLAVRTTSVTGSSRASGARPAVGSGNQGLDRADKAGGDGRDLDLTVFVLSQNALTQPRAEPAPVAQAIARNASPGEVPAPTQSLSGAAAAGM